MTRQVDATEGLLRAFDVEIRIVAKEGQPPVWQDHPDEAEHWIYEIVQGVFRNVLGGVVQLEQDFVEPASLDQSLGVFAVPTAKNQDIVRGDVQPIAERIRDSLVSKFGQGAAPPLVRIEANKTFSEPHAGSASDAYRGGQLSVIEEEGRSNMPPYVVVQPSPGGGRDNGAGAPGGGSRFPGSALMWTGAAIGGLLIASIFLLSSNMSLKGENEALAAGQAQAAAREKALTQELAQAHREIEQVKFAGRTYIHELELYIENLDNQMADLIAQEKLKPPPVLAKPSPPSPDPFIPQNPDPFAEIAKPE